MGSPEAVGNAEELTEGLGPWRRRPLPHGFVPFPDDAVDGTIAERFELVAAQFARSTALSSPAGSWTYAELLDAVHTRAAGITKLLGEREPTPVAILAAHDGPLVVTILSVIVAGHIVVVLDPAAPAPALRLILDECQPPLVLHDAANAALAAELLAEAGPGSSAADLDSVTGTWHGGPERTARHPVMLAFTSGTSGTPKGAVITHAVLTNLVRGATNALGIGPHDRMPMLFPTSLAVAAYPMFLPLLNGGTLATLDVRSVGLEPVGEFLEHEGITLAYMAPTVVRFLVDSLGGRSFDSIRMIALGGELVDAEVVELTRRLFHPDLIAVGYGTTETGVISLYVLEPDRPVPDSVPAGVPVPEVELAILDDDGNGVRPGTAGEIAVVSPHMFAGYWRHPELGRFVLSADPLGRQGWQTYRTGDIGRLDRDGLLTVLGRLDTKVKIRGRFVVLGDVESALHQLDGVADAVVVPNERDGVSELVAYVASDGSSLRPTALRAALLQTREAFSVPSRWVLLDELPRLPNGKVDRRSLPSLDAIEGSTGAADREDVASGGTPHDDLRAAIRAIWENLLPVGSITVDEDFFHLGGDSLLAAQMLIAVEHQLGVTVPMGELVTARTVRELAEVVARLTDTPTAGSSTVARVQRGDESARPRLWFVHDLQGSAWRARHLAEHLGHDQPVWSFESPFLTGEPARFTRLDTFAARYVSDLLAVQPSGPYWLAGYSFGGICAYEMARQLRADGHEVAFLGVVDVGPGYRGPGWAARRSPFRPWFGVAQPPPAGSTVPQVVRHYRDMFRASPAGLARHVVVRSGLARIVDPIRFRLDIRQHGKLRPEWRLWYAWEQHWRIAARAWDRASRYDGRMDLFWASDSASSDASMGWEDLVDDLRIHRFDGHHMGILEEHGAPALAAALRAVVDRRLITVDGA